MIYETSTRSALAKSFGPTFIVLATIGMTTVLIRTLGQASTGKVNPTEVGYILAFNLMGQLPTILSLSLYIAVVATIYRMYMDSEMIIWQMNGKTFYDLTKQIFIFAWPVLLIIFLLCTFAWPWMNQQTELLKTRFENRSSIERVSPGSFQESANGNRVFFIDKNSIGNKSQNVFISTFEKDKQNMTSAKLGYVDAVDGEKFLMLEIGQQIETSLTDNDMKLVEFNSYGTKLTSENVTQKPISPRAVSTSELIIQASPANLGELTWRFGIFFAAINYIVMAVALTSPSPRLGRGGNFMLAMLFFVFYNNMINVGQSWVSSGRVNWLAYLATLHVAMFMIGTGILYMRRR
jgi:lipopolysaccharide export system permease protein